MVKKSEEDKAEIVSTLFDLLFKGRGREVKTIGNSDSTSARNISKSILARGLLKKEIAQVEEEIKTSVLEGDFDRDNSLEQLIRLARTWEAMKLLAQDDGNEKLPEIFLFDSLFLKECYDSLFSSEAEEELFLTGAKFGRLNVTTKRLEFETKGTDGRVEDLPLSSHKVLKRIDKYGMPFLGAFHSHPNYRRPRPSDTDLDQFGKYEEHGFRVIGGIFTRNGYIRFFTKNEEFEVIISGERIEKLNGRTYRLEHKEI